MNKKLEKAIIKSIEHWKKDILEPLSKGMKIKESYGYGRLKWAETGRGVKCYVQHCPLCKHIKQYDGYYDASCKGCPLVKKQNCCESDKSSWYTFRNKPNITNARKMVKLLQSCLEKNK